jgi:hypothetical protein
VSENTSNGIIERYQQGPHSETCSKLRHSNLQQKAVCPDLFATLPNVFDGEILILFANNIDFIKWNCHV